jgi:hypothetical protein
MMMRTLLQLVVRLMLCLVGVLTVHYCSVLHIKNVLLSLKAASLLFHNRIHCVYSLLAQQSNRTTHHSATSIQSSRGAALP